MSLLLLAFSTALHDNQTLVSLELGSNGLKDEAAEHIAAMLKENTKLEGLSLFQNQITGQVLCGMSSQCCRN